MKKNNKSVLKYFIEFLIVAFGVFLGMYVSEIQSEKKTKLEKEKSMRFIYEELQNNRQKLETAIAYHESIKKELDSILKILDKKAMNTIYMGNEIFHHNDIKGWNGIQLANLEDTAFEATKISGIISEFDIEFIQNISRIYNYQNDYAEFGKSILTKMVNLNSSSKIADLITCIDLMTSDLANNEKALLNGIKKIKLERNSIEK